MLQKGPNQSVSLDPGVYVARTAVAQKGIHLSLGNPAQMLISDVTNEPIQYCRGQTIVETLLSFRSDINVDRFRQRHLHCRSRNGKSATCRSNLMSHFVYILTL